MLRILTLLLLICATASPAQNSDLRRLTLRQDILGWEAIGRLDLGPGSFCTGALIATDLVLTAAHCVLDRETGALRPIEGIRFRAGYADGVSIAERDVRQMVAHPRFRFDTLPTDIDVVQYDAALVVLSDPIPAATAAPFIVATPSSSVSDISVVSYAQDREEALSWQRSCNVIGRRGGLLAFDCDVNYGSSGAPVLDRSGNRARIVSLISSGARTEEGVVSLGMELPPVIADLKAALRAAPSPAVPDARRLVPGSSDRNGGARFVRP